MSIQSVNLGVTGLLNNQLDLNDCITCKCYLHPSPLFGYGSVYVS